MPASSSSLAVVNGVVAGLPGQAGPLSRGESLRLVVALGSVPDPRNRRGVRHSLQSVLLLVVGGLIAGKTHVAAIAGWAARADHQLRVCGPTPSAATIARVLAGIDPRRLQAALDEWTAGRLTATRASVPAQELDQGSGSEVVGQALAVDGKVLRGARTLDGQVKLVAAYDQQAGLVVGQVAVTGGDEIAALPAVLDTMADLQGVLVTADALHAQRSHATYIVGRGGHYLLTVKGNQRRLRDALADQPWGQVPGVVQRSAGHGRRETRSIRAISTSTQPGLVELFPHTAQIAKIVRRRHHRGGRRSIQTVYAITSLNHRQATPEQLAGWARGQWAIENGLHWVRDVTDGEDACRVRTGHAPQNLAALRNTVINLFRFDGHANIAETHRVYADQPGRIADLIHAA